jgi:mannose-6-phosphate isomerase-like protein (cupin superfamily)
MSRRRIALLLVSTTVLVATVAFVVRRTGRSRFVAVLPHADGLRTGAAMTYLGIEIGRVGSMYIQRRRLIADIQLTRRDVGLRRGDSVRVRVLGLQGDKVLDLVRSDTTGPLLRNGDTLYFAPPPRAARMHTDDHRIGRSVVDRVGPDEIAEAMQGVSPSARGVVFPGSSDDHAQYIYNRRATQSDVEQHDEWDDILIIQDGRGVIRYGGTWRNARAIYAGERRGGSLADPQEFEIGPGDVVRIPAGEPHRIVPLADTPLTYLVVKVHVDRGSQ